MKLTTKQEKEIWEVYDTWLHGYLNGNWETYHYYLDKDYHFIGSTNNEEFLDREAATQFFKETGDQLAGKTDLRNHVKFIENFGELVFLNHFFDAWFLAGTEWNYYGRFRFSNVLHKTKEGWRFIYQHYSTPDSKTQEGETIGFDQISAENLQLREAIKRRTKELEEKNRELEIETALEKVRSRSMAMHKSDELADLSLELVKQVQALGVETWFCAFNIYDDDPQGSLEWGSNGEGTFPRYRTPREGIFLRYYEAGQRGDTLLVNEIGEAECPAHYEYLCSLPGVGDQLLKMKDAGISFPTYQIDHVAFFKYGYIIFITYKPVPEAHGIFKRFAKVFEQTYTRFLDLQKAEAQAREAQVEAALERIRTQSMLMQHSGQLENTLGVFHEQVLLLGIHSVFSFLWLPEEEKNQHFFWTAWPESKSDTTTFKNKALSYPLDRSDPETARCIADWKSKKKVVSYYIPHSGLKTHFEAWGELTEGVDILKPVNFSDGLHYYEAFMNYGCFGFMIEKEMSEDEKHILYRIAVEFERTYTRFLDLQKAEAQAREAEIELSLERVRARAMAMHASSELEDVGYELRVQMGQLAAKELETCAINLYDESEDTVIAWGATRPPNANNEIVGFNFSFPKKGIFLIEEMIAAYRSGQEECLIVLEGEKMSQWLKVLAEAKPELFDIIDESIHYTDTGYHKSWFSCAFFPGGTLIMITFSEPENEPREILKRFSRVFGLAYRRFADLQKAEAQARESQIQLALERVRARTMAMQKSEELADAAAELFTQMNQLVPDLWSGGFVLCEEGRAEDEWWFSTDKGFTRGFFLPNTGDYAHASLYEGWEKGEAFRSVVLEGEMLQQHYNWLMGIEISRKIFEEMDAQGIERPSWQKLHAAYFSKGYLAIITTKPCDEEKIFTRFAKVFDLVYTRFLDLQKAEAQAREAQIQLGLERVRSRAMAMQHSDELDEVLSVLCEQFDLLDIFPMSTHMTVFNFENNTFTFRETGKYGNRSFGEQIVNLDAMDTWKDTVESWRNHNATDINRLHFPKETLPQVWEVFHESFASMPEDSRITPEDYPDGLYHTAGKHPYGYIGMNQTRPATKEEEEIVLKFAKEFGAAYTRFLDLQKAEAQTRESQINLAVERVRAKALAMYQSNDIMEVVFKLKEEIMGLNIAGVAAANILLKVENGMFRNWDLTSMEQEAGSVHAPSDISFNMEQTDPGFYLRKVWENGEKYTVVTQDAASLQISTNWLRQHHKIQEADEADAFIKATGLQKVYHPTIPLNNGRMCIDLVEPPTDEVESILTKMSAAFNLAYKRFEDLQKAEAQAREAEIELALERIRSQAMAMKESADLLDIVVTMRKEFTRLGHEAHYFWHMRWLPDQYEKAMTSGDGSRIGMIMKLPRHIHGDIPLLANWEKGDEQTVIYPMDADAAIDYVDKMVRLGDFQQIDHNAPTADDIRQIGGLTFVMAKTKHGEIGYSLPGIVPHPPEEDLNNLKRFTSVFDLAYRRFEDLKTTEEKNRETEVELALERVRSRSMAMQKSSELKDVIQVVYKQFIRLNIYIEHTGFIMDYKERNDMHIWLADREGVPSEVTFPYFDCAHWNSFKKAKEKGDHFFANQLGFEEKNKFYNDLFNLVPGVPAEIKEYYLTVEGLAISTVLMDTVGLYIENFKGIPYTEEENKVLMRFGNVFQQTYTRFLDLQKAEDQAREAQIEAALEKVRSRSLAMQSPNELADVVTVIVEKLKELNVVLDANGVVLCTYFNNSRDVLHWIVSPDFSFVGRFLLPYFDHPIFNAAWESKENGDAYFSKAFSIEEKNSFFKYAFEHSDYRNFPEEFKEWIFKNDKHILSFAWQKNSAILVPSHTGVVPTEEHKAVLVRFSKVFEQAYVRFMDLQKAEAQAREAQVEAGLERVRSRTMAMQHSEELAETAAVLFQQLIALGIEPHRLYIAIVKDGDGEVEFWITDEDGTEVSSSYSANMNDNPTFAQMFAGWKQQQKSLVIDMQGEELKQYLNHLSSLGVPFKGGLQQHRRVQDIAYFDKGFIGMASPDVQPETTLQLLERFAAVFNLTFTRFNDLKIAEAHALKAEQDLIEIKAARQNAEAALKELQATQKQLIQSEKMASLGELTAGIAHEIQNPLNFVNNFSEVSNELLDELKSRSEQLNIDDDEVNDLLNDIRQNIEKINHHGKRADAIVKGMLQHSRSSSGVKEPTDINALTDEYLRLAYHGLRAKDKSFNATIKTEFDPSLEKIHVIPQDIGRVVLNLITNAFYACTERSRKLVHENEIAGTTPNGKYEPTVTISTKKNQQMVEVSVADNGNGIPQKVLDKIFQPFFTTKPTGQGTGLGLSLAFDIVKAHGGELKVDTTYNGDADTKNAGSMFTIILPIQ